MSENSCSSSEEEDLVIDESKVQELENKVIANLYDYVAHTELLNLLDQGGDVDRCREVRERMSGLFPLAPEMWLQWINQERLFLPLDKERVRDTISNLYSRAVKDYSCVRLWCQYCSDVVSVLEYSEEKTRELFEQALSDVGLHVTKGIELWEQYRQYEEALFHAIQDKVSSAMEDGADKEFLQDLHNKQRSRVENLFQRQLAVPLNGLESVLSEYKVWLGEGIPVTPHLLTRYEAALKKREAVVSYEEALENTAAPHEEEYHYYIEYERKHGDPARVICLMERALTDNPLDSSRWIDYLQYLDQVLKVKGVVLRAYSRAIRNVPWIVDVWTQYMLAQQRYQLHFSHIDETLEEALKSSFVDARSNVLLWKSYLTCHWRQERFKPLKTNGSSEEPLENSPLNQAFQKAFNIINQNFGEEGDPTGELTRFMAECEAERDDITSFRLLMSGLFDSKIYKEQSRLWLEYISMEQRYGGAEDTRRVFQKAIQCSTDNTELILQNFLHFESVHGTLETYDNAALKCRRQQKKIDEKRAKEAEKQGQFNKKQETKIKQGKKQVSDESKPNTKNKQPSQKKRKISSEPADRPETKHTKQSPSSPQKAKFPKNPMPESGEIDKSKYAITVFVSNLSYSATEDDLNSAFKHIGDIVDIRLVKSANNKSRGFGYIEFHNREEMLAALELDRVLILGRPCYVSECKEKSAGSKAEFKFSTSLEKHKLFVNNLPYTLTEVELREMFGKIGELKSVRMVSTKSGKFKGYAYVEYVNSEHASRAVMELNDVPLGDRNMGVAISNPPGKSGESSSFKHRDQSLESEKVDNAFGRKKKMNFLVPRAVSQPKSVTENKQTHNTAAAASEVSGSTPEASESQKSNDMAGSDAPKQMRSNDFFSDLFKS